MATSKVPYSGGPEKLIVGVDIGTTSSAVAFAHLVPGVVPVVRSVQHWPNLTTESKVPTLVLFDSRGNAVAHGAECLLPGYKNRSDLQLAQYFKLSLHPKSIHLDITATLASEIGGLSLNEGPTLQPKSIVPDFTIPPLPANVSIEAVFGSFIAYLFKHAREWFAANTAGGAQVWSKLESAMEIVMATPDGWDDYQQKVLRKACVRAGVLEELDDDRLQFLREAEASVHFALKSPSVQTWLKPGAYFTVADLGGSTADVCMYRCDSITPKLNIREVKPSDCVQAGGIFVDRAFETLVNAKLAGSRFDSPDTIADIVKIFEADTKRRFSGHAASSIVKFGGARDSDQGVGVSMGRLTLPKSEMEASFQFCVNEICNSVKGQLRMGSDKASHIIVTGGFGESIYLQSVLRSMSHTCTVETGDEPTKKAIAEGGVLWALSQIVSARAARSTFGIEIKLPSQRHFRRLVFEDHDGLQYVRGAWSTIVAKGAVLKPSSSLELPYVRLCSRSSDLRTFSEAVYVYDGLDTARPEWCKDTSGTRQILSGFSHRCDVRADLSQIRAPHTRYRRGTTELAEKAETDIYWKVEFSVCLFVAQNSLMAKLKWTENGFQREGKATVVLIDPIDQIGGGMQTRGRAPADTIVGRPDV